MTLLERMRGWWRREAEKRKERDLEEAEELEEIRQEHDRPLDFARFEGIDQDRPRDRG